MTEYNVSESAAAKSAAIKLQLRFSVGREEQARLVKQVAALHIQDKLIPPSKMFFHVEKDGRVYLAYDPNMRDREVTGELLHVHPHALSQMCSVSGFKKVYANFLTDDTRKEKGWADWGPKLFRTNIETLFHSRQYVDRRGAPTKFLHRIVNSHGFPQLRGFMSRNFGRHLASRPLLDGFMAACGNVGAEPIEASVSDVLFSLRCFIPYPFEPFPGEIVSFGVSWSNSDFGAGRMKVSLCAMRTRVGSPIVFEDALSRTHLGSIIQESDLEVSEETAEKEVAALKSAIRDSVQELLKPESIERLCRAISVAHAENISWAKLKSIGANILGKGDLEDLRKFLDDDSIVDLPPVAGSGDDRAPTRWWASNAISQLSARPGISGDRSEELKELAGKILNV